MVDGHQSRPELSVDQVPSGWQRLGRDRAELAFRGRASVLTQGDAPLRPDVVFNSETFRQGDVDDVRSPTVWVHVTEHAADAPEASAEDAVAEMTRKERGRSTVVERIRIRGDQPAFLIPAAEPAGATYANPVLVWDASPTVRVKIAGIRTDVDAILAFAEALQWGAGSAAVL